MQLFRSSPLRDAQPWWLLGLLGLYAVLELSFNHHLMQVSSASAADLHELQDLEFWARIISGLGLAFWLMRAMLGRLASPVLAVLLSVVIGVTFMWHAQRWLVDGIVEHASEADKRMSLYAQQLAPQALAGQVQVRGLALVQPEQLSEATRPAWHALLPAVTLGLLPQDLQLDESLIQALSTDAGEGASELLTDAYRRAVMVPIALGLSLLFGLANLCLLLSLVAQRCWPSGLGTAPWRQRAVFMLLWASVLAWSWERMADDVESAGYREVTRPALRSGQPLLAPFVEWSLRAEPVWHAPTRWMHQTLLGGYGFRRLPPP